VQVIEAEQKATSSSWRDAPANGDLVKLTAVGGAPAARKSAAKADIRGGRGERDERRR
jgi:hypothetical protein